MPRVNLERRGPDFIIAGAMKSGTTALYEFICEHPRVLPAVEKELHYFTLNQHLGPEWYFSNFPSEPGYLTGEASPSYFQLASNAMFRWMRTTCPRAKILVIVRDPVERAISHFTHLKYVNKDPYIGDLSMNEFFATDFEDVLRGATALDRLLSVVLRSGCYSSSYSALRFAYEADQIMIIPSVDLAERPETMMRAVFEFLELEPYQSDSFRERPYSMAGHAEELSDEMAERLRNFYQPDTASFLGAMQMDGILELMRKVHEPPGESATRPRPGSWGTAGTG